MIQLLSFVSVGQPAFHDLAFYDPGLYEGLRKLLCAAQTAEADEYFSALNLTCSVTLRAEEGGNVIHLVTDGNGGNVLLTASNVDEYVRKYAEYRMVTCREKSLEVWMGQRSSCHWIFVDGFVCFRLWPVVCLMLSLHLLSRHSLLKIFVCCSMDVVM